MNKLGSKFLNLWDEPFMQDTRLDDKAKLLYLYLLTNSLSNIAGVYKITDRRIAFDLDCLKEALSNLFEQLKALKKVYRCGDWVIIKDAPLYIKAMTKTTIKKMDEILYSLPDKIKEKMKRIHYKYAHLYDELLIEEIQKGKLKTIIKKENQQELFNTSNITATAKKAEAKNNESEVGNDSKDTSSIHKLEDENVRKKNNQTAGQDQQHCEQNRTNSIEVVGKPASADIFKNLNLKKASELENTSAEELFEENEMLQKDKIVDINTEEGKPFGAFYKATVETNTNETKDNKNNNETNAFETKSQDLDKFRESVAKQILQLFISEGFYKGMSFNYFYKADFNRGIKMLKERGISLDDHKDAYSLYETVKNFIKIGKLQLQNNTWYSVNILFYKLCEACNYNIFTPNAFDINFFKGQLNLEKEVISY